MSKKIIINALILALGLGGFHCERIQAQESPNQWYIPLIGITSIPDPLALPKGPADVTYNYAVKNFLQELPLIGVQVTDDKCSPVKFLNGDDNGDSKLDYNETWRYSCTTKLLETSQSVATATGVANNLTAIHQAYATVVVGSKNPPPLVSIVNISKIAYPLSLPSEGGDITFTYKVNNPGMVPLSKVTVFDDKCKNMSGRLGDTNGNNLLDTNEVWIYTCTTRLNQTTTNTATVTAYANDLKAISNATITVTVETPVFPSAGSSSNSNPDLKIVIWKILLGILIALIIISCFVRRSKLKKISWKNKSVKKIKIDEK